MRWTNTTALCKFGAVSCLAPLLAGVAPVTTAQELGVAPLRLSDSPYTFDTAEQHGIRVSIVARGLEHPFSFAFLPNGDALVVERGTRLRIVRNAVAADVREAKLEERPIEGVPDRAAVRNGGLHDIALDPQFPTNRWVYFTHNRSRPGDKDDSPPGRTLVAITVARARLSANDSVLTDVEILLEGDWSPGATGSRLAFDRHGMLYVTTGAIYDETAQELDSLYGKVLRLHSDGTVPADNPFVGRDGARREIFSIGHRDQLGLIEHPLTGDVLTAEHGPNGGDELNLILPGRNYGWPNYSFGRRYDGPRWSEVPTGPGVEQPLVVWLPSIAPTGLAVYTGDRFPAWRTNLFVGSARSGEIPRTGGLERVVVNERFEELRRERLLSELHQRIRDVRQGPDGLLYVLTDEDDGALLRIEPWPLTER